MKRRTLAASVFRSLIWNHYLKTVHRNDIRIFFEAIFSLLMLERLSQSFITWILIHHSEFIWRSTVTAFSFYLKHKTVFKHAANNPEITN